MVDYSKSYEAICSFGCSYSCYRWHTWADVMTMHFDPAVYHKFSESGAGIKHLYYRLKYFLSIKKLPQDTLLLIQIPNMNRVDVITDTFWSNMGDFSLPNTDAKMLEYFPDFIYHGKNYVEIIDHYCDQLNYLESIIDLINGMSYDYVLVHTDECELSLNSRLFKEENWCTLNHIIGTKQYGWISRYNKVLDIFSNLEDLYSNTVGFINDNASNYLEFQNHYYESDQRNNLEKINFKHDPHPSVSCARAYVESMVPELSKSCLTDLELAEKSWQDILYDYFISSPNEQEMEIYHGLEFPEFTMFYNKYEFHSNLNTRWPHE